MEIPFIKYKGYKFYPSHRTLMKEKSSSTDIFVGEDSLNFPVLDFEDHPFFNEFSLIYYLGKQCNFSCSYCVAYGDNTYFDGEDIEKYIKALDILGLKEIVILGGEFAYYKERLKPLLNLDSDVKITLYTNGFSIQQEIIDIFKNHKLNWMVTIHPDSFETEADCIEYFKGKFDLIKPVNIRNVCYMITSEKSLKYLYSFLKAYDKDLHTFTLVPALDANKQSSDFDFSQKLLEVIYPMHLNLNDYFSLCDRNLLNNYLKYRSCISERLFMNKNKLYGCIGGSFMDKADYIGDLYDLNIKKLIQEYGQNRMNNIKDECSSCIGNIHCFYSNCGHTKCTEAIKSVYTTTAICLGIRIVEKYLRGIKIGYGQIQQFV